MKLTARSLSVAAILFLIAGTANAAGWIIESRAVALSDNDTITILDDAKTQHKVRIAGIDAPEKGQAFGERSKQSLSALVFQKRVEARCYRLRAPALPPWRRCDAGNMLGWRRSGNGDSGPGLGRRRRDDARSGAPASRPRRR